MRVLEILGSLHRGGAETMIMNYYRAFDKSLCQMDFVIHAEFEDDYRDEAKSLGANVILLDRPGEVGALRYIRILSEAIKKNGPYDAIHIHTNYQAFLGVIAARKAGIRNIFVHSHTTVFTKKQLLINRAVFKLFRVKRLSCGKLAGDAFFGSNYTIINNAIPVSGFKLSNKDEIEVIRSQFAGKKIVGHLGSFTKTKNHAFMLDVMEYIKKKDQSICLLLFGEGELKNDIEKKIANRGLCDCVHLMGVTKDPSTAYHSMDLFLLPSLYEGFPVTLVEAQLSGTYSLASDSISKECDIGASRIEFLKLDKKLWAERILSLINSPIFASTKEINLDDYDVDKQWINLYNIYKNGCA